MDLTQALSIYDLANAPENVDESQSPTLRLSGGQQNETQHDLISSTTSAPAPGSDPSLSVRERRPTSSGTTASATIPTNGDAPGIVTIARTTTATITNNATTSTDTTDPSTTVPATGDPNNGKTPPDTSKPLPAPPGVPEVPKEPGAPEAPEAPEFSQYSLTCYISTAWRTIWTQKDKPVSLHIGVPVQEKLKYVVVNVQDVVFPAVPAPSVSALTTSDLEPTDGPPLTQWSPMHVTWKDDYEIAISNKAFNKVGNLDIMTTFARQKIALGDRYTARWDLVNKTWTSEEPKEDWKAPEDGFRFQNINQPAACIVYQTFEQHKRPFYISPVLLPPSGKGGNSVSLDNRLAVWFDHIPAVPGQMVVEAPPIPVKDTKQSHSGQTPAAKEPKSTEEVDTPFPRIPITQKFLVPLIRQDMVIHYDEEGYWQSGAPRPPEDEEPVEL